MCQIETGVDDRDRHAGSRRLDLVVADVMDPPLVRNQWVGRAEVRERDQSAVGLDVRNQTLSTERRNDALRVSSRNPPDVQPG